MRRARSNFRTRMALFLLGVYLASAVLAALVWSAIFWLFDAVAVGRWPGGMQ